MSTDCGDQEFDRVNMTYPVFFENFCFPARVRMFEIQQEDKMAASCVGKEGKQQSVMDHFVVMQGIAFARRVNVVSNKWRQLHASGIIVPANTEATVKAERRRNANYTPPPTSIAFIRL